MLAKSSSICFSNYGVHFEKNLSINQAENKEGWKRTSCSIVCFLNLQFGSLEHNDVAFFIFCSVGTAQSYKQYSLTKEYC